MPARRRPGVSPPLRFPLVDVALPNPERSWYRMTMRNGFGPRLVTIAITILLLFGFGVDPPPAAAPVTPNDAAIPMVVQDAGFEAGPMVVVEREHARPIPECAWTPAARASLIAMVRIESSSGRDVGAIAWTMVRRWLGIARWRGRSFEAYIVDTSAPLRAYRDGRFDALTTYQACVLGVEGVDCPGLRGSTVEAEVGAALDAWARGDLPDPCDGESFQWFAPWWRASSRTDRVACGDTANQFRTLPRVSHAHYAALVRKPVNPRTCR